MLLSITSCKSEAEKGGCFDGINKGRTWKCTSLAGSPPDSSYFDTFGGIPAFIPFRDMVQRDGTGKSERV